MRYAPLGSLEVSVIGVGCNNFGRALDEAGSAVVVDAALSEGINFFDTADNYGSGHSQAFLGRALGARRDEAIIATKFGMPVPQVPESGGARPEYVRAAVERSLGELGTDRIDLLQLHRPDPNTPIAETIGVMAELVTEGKALEIGCSNLDGAQLTEAMAIARTAGHPLFISNQMEYSMLFRDPETNGVAAACRDEGVALLPFYPLACGMLTGKAQRNVTPEGRLQMERYQHYLSERNYDIVEQLGTFAAERGISMVQIALGWLLSRPEVPAVTPGATRPEQIRSNATAAAWEPSQEDLHALDSVLAAAT